MAISGNYDEFSGLKVPPPSPAGFGETELGALPAACSGPSAAWRTIFSRRSGLRPLTLPTRLTRSLQAEGRHVE